jgi:ATP-dependent zinc metalloprotease YME1 homolog
MLMRYIFMTNNNNMVLKQLFQPHKKQNGYLLPSTTVNYHSIQEICDFKQLSYLFIREIMVNIKSYFYKNGQLPNNQYLYDLILTNQLNHLDFLPKTFEVINPKNITTSFDKIYGNNDLKTELMNIVKLFQYETSIFNHKNNVLDKINYPKGFILHGEAGVGKTMFAKAIAKECNLPFISISGSAFNSRYVGDGKDLIQLLFSTLRQVAPVILFIDEIDAIGQRNSNTASHADEIINQLLAEIDGVNTNPNKPIMIIGATNYVDKLDSALIRPCRFDKIFKVEKPTVFDLKNIVLNIAKEYDSYGCLSLSENDYDYLTRTIYATNKGTGAFVANLFKLAHMKCKMQIINNSNMDNDVQDKQLHSIQTTPAMLDDLNIVKLTAKPVTVIKTRKETDKIQIDKKMLDELIDELTLGNEIKLNQLEQHTHIKQTMKKRTAYHEAGHAAIAYLLSNGNHDKKVRKVTVVPRNNALGVTYIGADYDLYEKSQESMLNQICIAFAGACAESVFLDNGKNTGASSDIKHATEIANLMVREYGLAVYDEDLVDVIMNYNAISNQLSDMIKNKLDMEVITILKKEKQRCHQLIVDNKDFIQLITDKLIDCEVIFEEEINEIAKSLDIMPI